MSNCVINSGYALGCRDNTGGIQKALVNSFSADTVTWSTDAAGVITGQTGAGTYYTFQQRNETGSFNQTGQHSPENGTNFWEQNVELVFHKYEASSRNLLYSLALNELSVIVQDQNGKYFLVGQQNGANLIASEAGSGKAYGDMNGSTVTIQGKEPIPAREISPALIATLTIV
jgi:hypothetical protein